MLKHRRESLQRTLRPVHIVMPHGPFLQITKALMDTFRWRLSARMNAYRHVKLLRFRPEGVVIRMCVRFIRGSKRYEERAPAATLYGAFQFTRRLLRITEGNMRDGNEPPV